MDSNYSNGLSYVPYQSKRHSRHLSSTPSEAGPSTPTETQNAVELVAEINAGTRTPPRATSPLSPSSSPASASPLSSRVTSPQPPTPVTDRPVLSPSSSRNSTFRRIGGTRTDTTPASPSPLRPRPLTESSSTGSRRTLVLGGAGSTQNIHSPPPPSRVPSSSTAPQPPLLQPTLAAPVPSPLPKSNLLAAELPIESSSSTPSISPNPSPQPIPPPPPSAAPPESIRVAINTPPPRITSPAPPRPRVISQNGSASGALPSRATSASPGPMSSQKAPYRPGFQPKGVYNDRTDEFMTFRSQRVNHQRGEERRIERRLEKLLNLHFPTADSSTPNGSPTASLLSESDSTSRPSSSRRSSSFFADLKGKRPGELLRSVMEPKPGTPAALRAAEQVITPWQDDALASACPICQAAFHPITNRKHHCRLCGRVVCSLPPTAPSSKKHVRPKACSSLVTMDPQTGRVKEVPEVIAYGVSKRTSSASSTASIGGPENGATPKNFRICRDCNGIVSRKEMFYQAHASTAFTRLYDLLIRVEGEIETHLSSLQAMMHDLTSALTNPEALILRKQLSSLFTDYDAIAKRIKSLPCTPGGSQDRVQQAVWIRAVNFMQINVGLLQRMPIPTSHKHKNSTSVSDLSVLDAEKVALDGPAVPPSMSAVEADAALAHKLQPLLEQEALLESFIQEASAQRKFEDVKTLKGNLGEIRNEISKMAASSNLKV